MAKIHHLVLVRFKDETSESTIKECFLAVHNMCGLIPGLESITGGPYSSPEGLNKGFTHSFAMVFKDAAARDIYLPHPDHETVKQLLLQHVDDVIAFDYEM